MLKEPAAGGDQIKGDRGWWLRSWVRLVASNRKPLYKNWNPNETVVEGEDSALIVPNFDVTIFPDAPKNDNKFVLLVRLKLVKQIPYNFTEPSHCAVHRLEMMSLYMMIQPFSDHWRMHWRQMFHFVFCYRRVQHTHITLAYVSLMEWACTEDAIRGWVELHHGLKN